MTLADGVTVAVCSRDRPQRLRDCLAATRGVLRAQDRLLVVDSASSGSGTLDVARSAGADTIRVDVPGLSRARNAALDETTTDLLLFTDDDCRPHKGWVQAVTEAFAADDRIAFVTGRVLATGGGSPTAVHDDPIPRRLDASTPLDGMGHGANMAVRVAPLREIGGYDPSLGAGAEYRAGEDSDVFRRLLDAGWLGQYTPDAVVEHEQWRTRPEAVRMAYGYGLGFGAVAAKAYADGRGRALLRRGAVDSGILQAWRNLRTGYELGVIVSLSWTTGVVLGYGRARRRGVDGPMLMPPTRRRS